ncbi:hypothetical protein D9M71_233960 [compost metagenome]
MLGGSWSLTSTTWISTVRVGTVLQVEESSVCESPVRLSTSCSRVPSTTALLPRSSPSLISLWGAPDGGL